MGLDAITKRRLVAGPPMPRSQVVIVQEFRQLFSQALIALAVVPANDCALKELFLQLLRQIAPQVESRCAESEAIAVAGRGRLRRYTHEDHSLA
jgi:hypothetical protein